MDMSAIQRIMDTYSQKVGAKLGIGCKDFENGQELYLNADEPFPAASTFKVPLLIALYEQAAKGCLSLDDTYILRDEDMAIGSGVLSELTPGVSMSLRDYATLMMIISDNTATDVIYKHVGQENISKVIAKMNLKNTKCDMTCDHLVRITYSIPLELSPKEAKARFTLEDSKVNNVLYENMDGPNVTSSPRDMVTMFSLIWNHEIASPEACEEMISIMSACQTNSRIPYYLPRRGSNKARIAHKTGSLYAVANDSGIISTATRCYALSLFCNGFHAPAEERAKHVKTHLYDLLLAELSRDIFQVLHKTVCSG
jgi:beta-lactamase class A